jgi:hypothetical protein
MFLGENMYKVYSIYPRKECYKGISLVSADTIEEANLMIEKFDQEDIHNVQDSGGYSYVNKNSEIPRLFSDIKGIIFKGIYYYG